ncbi:MULTISPECIES: hypothetical protein [Actinomycetes]|uniref:hypothetical protein n=1 Tax=Actinomycetes TaxID=1760 RepID=UPI0033EA66E0
MPSPTVVRAEAYYVPPPRRPGSPTENWSAIPVAQRIFEWYRARLNRIIPPPTSTISDLVYARVNHSRWLGDCGFCGNAQYVSPADPRMGCPECRAPWVTVVWPDDIAAVEAEMLAIPLDRDRNWWHPSDPNNPYIPIPEPGP